MMRLITRRRQTETVGETPEVKKEQLHPSIVRIKKKLVEKPIGDRRPK